MNEQTRQRRSILVDRLKEFDLQDLLLILGVASIVWGAWQWSRPVAFVVFGFFCLVGVAGRARAPRGRRPEGKI